MARKKRMQYMNGYRRQLARSHEQLRVMSGENVVQSNVKPPNIQNSNLRKWAARSTITNEAYIKSNQSQQGRTHTNITKTSLLFYL